MTFNPDGMDLRPCRQSAPSARLVLEGNEPAEAVMRALVYQGHGQKAWEEVPGPVGLSAITGAWLYSPSHVVAIDLSDARLHAAKQFGADIIVSNSREDPLSAIKELTGRLDLDEFDQAYDVFARAADTHALKVVLTRGE
jgi:Zn-dependent alcohol dehydrogenase